MKGGEYCMSKYVLLKCDGVTEIRETESKLELKTMYEWIGNSCRCIDIATSVISKKMGCEVLLIFDDEFLLNCAEPKANEIASLLFGYSVVRDECLCGNVIIAKGDGDKTIGFTDEEIKKLKKFLNTCKKLAAITQFTVQKPSFQFIPCKL